MVNYRLFVNIKFLIIFNYLNAVKNNIRVLYVITRKKLTNTILT